jgi:acetyltransferase-like isoleucine patch superfamily enzyme
VTLTGVQRPILEVRFGMLVKGALSNARQTRSRGKQQSLGLPISSWAGRQSFRLVSTRQLVRRRDIFTMLILPGAILRGDLRRTSPGQHVVISIGRYCLVGEGSVVRPPGKCYKGYAESRLPDESLMHQRAFTFYPMRISDNVHIGPECIVEAASIGYGVTIGEGCIVVSS